MTARLDESGLPPINPLPHPTPQHIRGCVTSRLYDIPNIPLYQIMNAIDEGISTACREHDKAQGT